MPKPVEEGGSWRITDPDTGQWDGVDFARTWGGRYRFHFVDLGAAPNAYESATWLNSKLPMSSRLPARRPADLAVRRGSALAAVRRVLHQQSDRVHRRYPLPVDAAPRAQRRYGLFFRSTPGYLYRPIPRGDVNWLAVTSWTDFYSRPQ